MAQNKITKEVVTVTDPNGKSITIIVTESSWEVDFQQGIEYIKGTIQGFKRK